MIVPVGEGSGHAGYRDRKHGSFGMEETATRCERPVSHPWEQLGV